MFLVLGALMPKKYLLITNSMKVEYGRKIFSSIILTKIRHTLF